MNRHYILKNKSQLAIISSIFLHSLLLFSIRSDQFLGTTNKPIEFTEIKVIAGPGESINKNNLVKVKNQKTQKKIEKEIHSNKINEQKYSKSEIPLNPIKKKENIKSDQNNNERLNTNINISSKLDKSTLSGNKSNNNSNETQKGRLKGKGKKKIICKKCIEPKYSQKSIRKGLEGITIVKVTIDTNGLVKNAKIINSSGHKVIDNASISAAMKSTFQPISEESSITIKYDHKIK